MFHPRYNDFKCLWEDVENPSLQQWKWRDLGYFVDFKLRENPPNCNLSRVEWRGSLGMGWHVQKESMNRNGKGDMAQSTMNNVMREKAKECTKMLRTTKALCILYLEQREGRWRQTLYNILKWHWESEICGGFSSFFKRMILKLKKGITNMVKRKLDPTRSKERDTWISVCFKCVPVFRLRLGSTGYQKNFQMLSQASLLTISE